MLNEKYNNAWKSELNQLSAMPGEAEYDMNAAWEKLDTRLQEKQNNKKFPLYWIAAACICGCIMIASVFFNNKKQNTTREIVTNNKPAGKKEIVQIPIEKEIKAAVSISTIKKNKMPVQPTVKNPVVRINRIVPEVNLVKEIITEKKDSLIVAAPVSQIIKSKPIVFTSLKKKMPLVHINELEKPVQPIEAVAGNNDHSPLRVRFFNRSIQPGTAEPDNENSNTLKIKLPPQN